MKVSSGDIRQLLIRKFNLDIKVNSTRHALFFEFNTGTGYNSGKNYIDAFVIDLWPSGLFARTSYEIKTSRSDFLSELNNPNKRKWAMDISNEFWFVCAPNICDVSEIPENCGLLVVTKDGKKLRKIKVAKYRETSDFTMNEVMSIARQSCNYNMLANPKWSYQGSELSESSFDSLVDRKVEKEMSCEIERRVEEGVNEKMAQVNSCLLGYSEAMSKAGVVPPAWMGRPSQRDRFTSQWDAERWVNESIKQPPSVRSTEKALKAIERLKHEVKIAEDNLTNLLEMVT